MKITSPHAWNIGYREARTVQEQLAEKLILRDDHKPLKIGTIAGADISYSRHDDLFFASVLILDFETMEVIEESYFSERVSFPYIPGLLTFREGPPLIRAFEKLQRRPDAVIFDGQGIAHPRGFGLASHLGLILDIPSIGCAKTRLVGTFQEPGPERGDFSDLLHDDAVVGSVLRTRNRVKPLFISQGHRISLATARAVVLASCRGYRLPEPTRRAHLSVNRLRLSFENTTNARD